MASTYLSKTFAQAGNRRTFTISYWIKMGVVSTGADQAIMGAAQDGSNSDDLYIHTGRLNFSGYYGSTAYQVRTSAKYRDTNAWGHHVIRFDSTQSTASDRLRLYVNGVLQTALDNNTYPSQNLETTYFNTAREHAIGSIAHSMPNLPFDGSMAHFHFCDGYSYGADSFGETDSTTGQWKPKTAPSVSYGTNGFFLKFENSASMGADSSGQGNNWTVNGPMTQRQDSPSNDFCTINRLVPSDIASLGYGNTVLRQSDQASAIGTLGFQGGKFYWEVKNSNQQSYTQLVGVLRQARMEASGNDGYNVGTNDGSWGYFMQSNQDNGKSFHNNTLGSVYQTTSANDILQVAVDGTAGKIWWGVNGTWVNSGDPANGTNAVYTNLPTDDVLFPAFSNYNAGQFQINFGDGYFGQNAVSSAGTNASGIGIFEYDVPTGFTALSTKGLNE